MRISTRFLVCVEVAVAACMAFLAVTCTKDNNFLTPANFNGLKGSVSGKVFDKRNNTMSGVSVTAYPAGNTTLSGADGSFTVGDLPAGNQLLEFHRADYADTSTDSITLTLLESKQLNVPVHMRFRYAWLRGTVTCGPCAASGMIDAGVQIENQVVSTRTLPTGSFLLPGVLPGDCKVYAAVSGVGYGMVEKNIPADDTTGVTIAITNVGGTVQGTVTDANENPAVSAIVSTMGNIIADTTDIKGAFKLTEVPASGRMTLTISKGADKVLVEGVQVADSQLISIPPVKLVSAPPGTLRIIPMTVLAVAGVETSIAVLSASSDSSVKIAWYEWDENGDGIFDRRTPVPIDTGLIFTAGSHTVKVRAVGSDTAVKSGIVDIIIATVAAAGPVAPSITSVTIGDNSVTVAWNNVNGAVSYNIYYAAGATVTRGNGTKVTAATSPKQIIGLTNGTLYSFAVSAVNSAGESILSGVQTATPQITIMFSTHDTIADTLRLDTLADAYYSDGIGPIPIFGAPRDTATVPLAGNYIAGTQIVPAAVPVTLKYVYHIEVADIPQSANVTVVNNSGATFGTVQITAGTLGTTAISGLQPNAVGTLQFDAAAKIIDSVMNVSVAVTPSSTGAFAGSDNLRVIFSFDGLMATRVVVLDSLLANYMRTVTNEYNLTGIMNVDYIDVAQGFFTYSVSNHTGAPFLLSVVHRDLWTTNFCQTHKPALASINDLAGLTAADSQQASTCDVAVGNVLPALSTTSNITHNISADRLFAEWDSTKQKSITKVDFLFRMNAKGSRITLAASDSLNFILKTTSIKFKELSGRTTAQNKVAGMASDVPVTYPWPANVLDSLRGKYLFSKILARTLTRLTIPQGAVIDTVQIHCDIAPTNNTTISVMADAAFLHATKDSLFERTLDITNLADGFPDSMRVNFSTAIPVQTRIVMENDLTGPTDPDYLKYMGRMIISYYVDISSP